MEWNLLNGNVILPDPLELTVRRKQPLTLPTEDSAADATTAAAAVVVRLIHPLLVGAGSGGAVFTFEESQILHYQFGIQSPTSPSNTNICMDDAFVLLPPRNSLVLKVSWISSRDSVRNECQILQSLEPYQIDSIEQCWGEFPYPNDADPTPKQPQQSSQRIMLLLSPYVSDGTSNIYDVSTKLNQIRAVQQLSQTMIQLLARNVVTIDVQPLISKETGQVVLIDFSEAQSLTPSASSSQSFTFSDLTLVNNFVTEMMTLIPDEFRSVAEESIHEEVQRLETQEGNSLSPEIKDILIDLDLLKS
jgi:hypothetical protein